MIILQEESENNTSSVVPELGIFSPTSEPDGTPNAFFTGDPEAQIRSGNFSKVPFITGVNSAEAVNIFTGEKFYHYIQFHRENYSHHNLEI